MPSSKVPLTRKVDICFQPDERLSRRLAADQVFADGRVRPQALRLQISVDRSSKPASPAPAPPKFNGLAEITVAMTRQACTPLVRTVCVDDPQNDNDAHALIAVITDHAGGVDEDVLVVRAKIANSMTIITPPRK